MAPSNDTSRFEPWTEHGSVVVPRLCCGCGAHYQNGPLIKALRRRFGARPLMPSGLEQILQENSVALV